MVAGEEVDRRLPLVPPVKISPNSFTCTTNVWPRRRRLRAVSDRLAFGGRLRGWRTAGRAEGSKESRKIACRRSTWSSVYAYTRVQKRDSKLQAKTKTECCRSRCSRGRLRVGVVDRGWRWSGWSSWAERRRRSGADRDRTGSRARNKSV